MHFFSILNPQDIWITPFWPQAKQQIHIWGSSRSQNTPIAMPFAWTSWNQLFPPSTNVNLDNTRFGQLWDPAIISVNYPVRTTEIEFYSTYTYCFPNHRQLSDGGTRLICFWEGSLDNLPYPIHLFNWDINHEKSKGPILVIYEMQAGQEAREVEVRSYTHIYSATRQEAMSNIQYTQVPITFRDFREPASFRTNVYYHRFSIPNRGQFVLNPNKRYLVAVSTVPFIDTATVWPEMQIEPAAIMAPYLSGSQCNCAENFDTLAPPAIKLTALASAHIDDQKIPNRNYSCGDPEYYWPGGTRYRTRHHHICLCLQFHRQLGVNSPFIESRDARPNLGVVGIKGVRLNTCGADVDCSGCIDDGDLLSVLFKFGEIGYPREDINGDFNVDDADLLEVLFNFGAGC